MSKEEKTRLVSPDGEKSAKMAEEMHPLPEKASGTASKRGSKANATESGQVEGVEASTSELGGGGGGSGGSGGGGGSGEGSGSAKRKRSCPVYFGVRSYLHHFYDSSSAFKDPNVYENDDDDLYLLHPNPHHRLLRHRRRRRRRCPPIWWKIFMWLGVNLLLFGVVGILVGYLVPPKTVVVGQNKPKELWYIDTSAKSYNVTLDLCKLIGLILFCVGGLTLAMALLFPSFLTHYCGDDDEDEDPGDENLKVPLRGPEDVEKGDGGGTAKPPLSPTELTIPASSKVKSVQPVSKVPQAVAQQTGAVTYKD